MAKRANGVMDFELKGSVLTFTFSPTQVVTYDAKWNFPEWDNLDDCQQRIILNGLKQRLNDGVGGSGKTLVERFEKMSGIAESLRAGNYSTRGEGGSIDLRLFARVVSIVKGKPDKFNDYLTALKGCSPAQLTKYMANPDFVAELERQRQAIVANVDVAALDAQIDAI